LVNYEKIDNISNSDISNTNIPNINISGQKSILISA